MIRCRHAAATEAARLLRSLRRRDTEAVHHQLERIRRTAPPAAPIPEDEQERWELLTAVAEALGQDPARRRTTLTTVAACRRLLEHLCL